MGGTVLVASTGRPLGMQAALQGSRLKTGVHHE